jgi:peptidyl-prolyl cis-trans isomerase D
MLTFFRRYLSSWAVLGLFGLILIAFVITGVGTDSSFGGGNGVASGEATFSVGGKDVGAADIARRAQLQYDAARAERPELDMRAFVAGGGVESTIDRMINGQALEAFANKDGMAASRRLVDGMIAGIPAFNGPTGKFDRNTFLSVLGQRKMNEAMIREDFAREAITQQMFLPISGAARAPVTIVGPFASLLLETRAGQVISVPASAIAAGPTPTDQELTVFYQRNVARYTVPERRVVRYALIDASRFAGKIAPTDAEIAAAYNADKARYAGREDRILTQIIVADQAGANAVAAKVRAGSSMTAAASTAGLQATTFPAQAKTAYAGMSAPAVADAAFTLANGGVSAPVKSPFGWHVVKVDSIITVPGKSIADVRGEIVPVLTQKKSDAAIADFVTKVEDQIADGSTFDDVIKAEGLAVESTPALTAGGIAPDVPAFTASEALPPILRDAFQAEPDDDPAVVTITPGSRFALYDLDKVVPAAPRLLTQIRDQVSLDFTADRALRAARKAADAIAAKVSAGTPIAQAISASGTRIGGAKSIGGRRMEITQAQGRSRPNSHFCLA